MENKILKLDFIKQVLTDTVYNDNITEEYFTNNIFPSDHIMYKSTMDVFEACYDKVSTGGQVIIDDWCLPMCREAVEDFRRTNNYNEELVPIDDSSVYWIKK